MKKIPWAWLWAVGAIAVGAALLGSILVLGFDPEIFLHRVGN